MLELLLCSLLTVLPDYLYRRYAQGKRFGKEITLFSVWYELRWGITACLMLTVGLITLVFYNHPSTNNVTLFFRTVPIISEANGRVAEVYVGNKGRDRVEQGAPIFKLDSSTQEAAVETARRKIVETDAEMEVARADVIASEGQIQQAQGAYQQALDELNTKREWDSEKHPAPGFWPSLDERIAAARAELDQPSAERRARVSRFDPTPWQDWPKGWDDEP